MGAGLVPFYPSQVPHVFPDLWSVNRNPVGEVGGKDSAGRLVVGVPLRLDQSVPLVEDDVEEVFHGGGVDDLGHRVSQHQLGRAEKRYCLLVQH